MRAPEFQFFSLDSEALTAELIAKWEKTVGTAVTPASPQRLAIAFATEAIIAVRAEDNHAMNRMLPSRAEGEDLDVLGRDLCNVERPGAEAATCTVRFSISEPQPAPVVVPMGTRVTDKGGALMWELGVDLYIQPGDRYADARVKCQTLGKVGNDYAKGQINTLVDLYDYCDKAENITASGGGADAADDDTHYELMRESMDAKGSGGARGAYIYNAKRASLLIGDVVANTTGPAQVAVYVLMADGSEAGEEVKAAVKEACSQDDRCPMTDLVSVLDPEFVDYNIALTYYIKKDAIASVAEIEAGVEAAVAAYTAWQSERMGRDINPDKLRECLMSVGKTLDKDTGQYVGTSAIKRVVLESPGYTVLRNGREKPDPETPLVCAAPQVARLGTVAVTNGGVEDE